MNGILLLLPVFLPLVLGLTVIIIPNLDPEKLGALVWKYKPEHMFRHPSILPRKSSRRFSGWKPKRLQSSVFPRCHNDYSHR